MYPTMSMMEDTATYLSQCIIPLLTRLSGVAALTGDALSAANRVVGKRISEDEQRFSATIDNGTERHAFRNEPMPFQTTNILTHPHAEQADARTCAEAFIRLTTTVAHKSLYGYQLSARDIKNGMRGVRNHFWIKDAVVESKEDEVQDNDVLSLIDVDYYVDMNELARKYRRSMYLYTFTPETTGVIRSEYKYSFDRDNKVHVRVNGGASYTHELWDYTPDVISVASGFFDVCYWFFASAFVEVPPPCVVSYDVEKRKVTTDHSVVMCSMRYKSEGFNAWYSDYCSFGADWSFWYGHDGFKRIDWVRHSVSEDGVTPAQDFVVFEAQHKWKSEVYISRVGDPHHNIVDSEVFYELKAFSNNASRKLTLYNVLSACATLRPDKYKNKTDIGGKSVAVGFLRATEQTVAQYNAPHPGVVKVQHINVKEQPGEDHKPYVAAFMQPICLGAIIPEDSAASEYAAVEYRSTRLHKDKFKVDARYMERLTGFIAYLKEHNETFFVPWTMDEVRDVQNTPGKIQAFDEAMETWHTERPIIMFGKKECYCKITDPRPISPHPTDIKCDYCMYIGPFMQWIKGFPWYAFGTSNLDIANKIADICLRSTRVIGTDYSRFDGHVNWFCRHVEETVMKSLLPEQFHEPLIKVMRQQHSKTGFTTRDPTTRYNISYQRTSGSMETSAFNGLINAFVAYCAYAEQGHAVACEMMETRSIFGGDDGLTGDVDPEVITKCAQDVGLSIKIESSATSDSEVGSVMFLSRVYSPDVWYGDPNSCCDIQRQALKLHLSVRTTADVPAHNILIEKMRAYLQTDKHTPLVGHLARYVCDVSADHNTSVSEADRRRIITWCSLDKDDMDHTCQYMNVEDDWMLDLLYKQIPTFDADTFVTWLSEAYEEAKERKAAGASMDSVMEPFMLAPVANHEPPLLNQAKDVVVVGDEVLMPGEGFEGEQYQVGETDKLSAVIAEPILEPRESGEDSQSTRPERVPTDKPLVHVIEDCVQLNERWGGNLPPPQRSKRRWCVKANGSTRSNRPARGARPQGENP
jgi:hypothetical protein